MNCSLCNQPVDPDADDTLTEVAGWVGGKKKDSMRARQATGNMAHESCVADLMNQRPPGQPDLFEEAVAEPLTPSDDGVKDLNSLIWGK